MKQTLLSLIVVFCTIFSASSQSINDPFFDHVSYRGAFGTDNWTAGWANFDPQTTTYPATTVTVAAGDIATSTTWTKDKVYLLNGWVYVVDGVTLTIEPGTVIRGDKANKAALIIEKGAKLIANGTADQPIVFTSNQAPGSRNYGDWGGIILCGKATVNKVDPQIEGGPRSHYGGTDDQDNSGSLKYVRIEFPGIAFQPDKEINGLTLGAVGSGTNIEYIQVSYSGDDSYEWFGGAVNGKHMIALRGWDDDFDTDYGYHGMVQFGVALRDPAIADPGSGSNGFESDNDGTGSGDTPITSAIFSNISMFGPLATPTTTINPNFLRGMHLRRNTKLNIYNAVFGGYVTGLYIEGPSVDNAKNNSLKLRNSVLAGCTTNFGTKSGEWTATEETTWFNTTDFKNATMTGNSDLMVENPFNLTAPNFLLKSGSPLKTGSYWYSPAAANTIDDPFFNHVSYRGAFGTDNWTAGWANFDPQTTTYPAATVTVAAGDIATSTTWTKDKVYLLNGWVYVVDGVTLTIEPGTVIRGDKANKAALIIEKGAKLIANGTADQPIVFTSNQAPGSRNYGDWGGIILCGKATVNKVDPQIEGGPRSHYGGTDDQDNSGSLKYVRIEFPGIAFQPDKEINGLTLGAVGSGTNIEYIQVSYSGDDSYEWFGGAVNAKHMIALRGWDDDFDTDYGYHGMVQFGVALRDPAIADPGSGSNGFESDNDGTGSGDTPITSAIFSNISMFGPLATPTTTINPNFLRGMHLRRNTKLNIYNAVFGGYVTGLYIEGPSVDNAKNNSLKLRNSVLAGCTTNFGTKSGEWTAAEETTWFNTTDFKNATMTGNSDLMVENPFNLTAPNFLLKSGSPLKTGSYWFVTAVEPTLVNEANLISYPNPFSGSTNIELQLTKSSFVRIIVTDITGRIVANLQQGNLTEGTHRFEFNGSALPKGMYIAKVITSDSQKSVKMISK